LAFWSIPSQRQNLAAADVSLSIFFCVPGRLFRGRKAAVFLKKAAQKLLFAWASGTIIG
jgi:hypothetical protein